MTEYESIGMSYRDILRYAEFAGAAYDDQAALREAFGDSVLLFDLPGCLVQVALIKDLGNRTQWLAVRGTANTRNVLFDGRIKVVREPRLGAYLHGGFLRASPTSTAP